MVCFTMGMEGYCAHGHDLSVTGKLCKNGRVKCQSCHRVYGNKSYHKHKARRKNTKNRNSPEVNRRYMLRTKYKMTLTEFNELLEHQDGCCAICYTTNWGKSRYPRVDHDHKTGKIRGLLCNNCNLGLGFFNDNTVHLARAITYLSE